MLDAIFLVPEDRCLTLFSVAVAASPKSMSHRATGGGAGPKMQSQRPARKTPPPKTQQQSKGFDKAGKRYKPPPPSKLHHPK